MLRAWTYGVIMLLVIDIVWLTFIQYRVFSGYLLLLLQITPFFAAVVTAYFAPNKKVFLGLSMAIPTAILITAFNYVYQLSGRAVDFPGIRGGIVLLTITLLYSSVLCAIGGSIGYFLTTKLRMRKKY